MNKNIPHSRPFFQEAHIFWLTWFRAQNLYPISGQKNPFSLGHPYCKSSIKPPSLSNKLPFPFNPLFPFPPLLSLFFTNLWYTIFINHNSNTSCGLVHDSFFQQLDFQICFWSSAAWPTTWAFPLCNYSSLRKTDTIVFAKLCRSTLPQMCLKQ